MVVSDAKEIVRAGLLDGACLLRKELINDLDYRRDIEEALSTPALPPTGISRKPQDVIYALADQTMRRNGCLSGLSLMTLQRGIRLASCQRIYFDPKVNRQVLLYVGVQALDSSWLPEDIHPETFLVTQGSSMKSSLFRSLHFRGAMYFWAAGFATDEQFAAETERALAMRATS